MRKFLNDVVQVRVTFWQMIRKRSETPEEYIRLFLDTEVRPIWPKGWITARILYKESHEAHSAITDRSYSRSVPVKKSVSLGGGTVISSTPQPPKPSLSATVLPKTSPTPPTTPILPTKPKGEPAKRKSISGDHREAVVTPGKQQPEEKLAVSSGVLSIRSVEKINEGAPRKASEEGEQTSEKQERQGSEESTGRDKPQSDKKAAITASSAVSIIDLSSDEEKTLNNKASLLSGTKSISVVSAAKDSSMSDEIFVMPSPGTAASAATKADGLPLESKKEDNLEEEMNLVMNEILQISKQKSADDSLDKIIKDSKDISPSPSQSTSSTPASVKQHHQHHSSSHSQETYHHQHHHHQHSHHLKKESQSSTTSSKQEQSSVSPGKHSSSGSPAKHHHSHHQTQESQSSTTSLKQEQSSVSSGKQSSVSPGKHSSLSPGKQSSSGSPAKQSAKAPLISPVKDQSLSTPAKQHSTQQHGQSEVTHSHPLERHSSKSSIADHSKHTLPSQEKHSSEHNSLLPTHKQASQRQTYGDPHHKPSPKLHSSKQERQSHSSHSLPLGEPKSPVQSQLQHPLSSLQHHSPSQHTTKQSQQHSLQQSQHSQRQQQQQQQQQPLNLQQPKQQQQHALNLQQPKVQHPPPSYHHSSSTSQYSLSQPHSTSPEPSRQKKQQSHYNQSHHQSQSNSKPSITSSWSTSSDVAIISKTSLASASKTHSTWASSHDVSPSRQRQSDAPIGSGNKKSSASSTSTTPSKASTSIPSLGSSSIGLHSTSKSSAHNYSSSQSKHSAPSLSYSSSSQHSTAAKASRLDPYVASMSQSLYAGMTAEQQLSAYKQLQQHQQTNHLTPHQQQELWQQMSSSGFLPGMSGMSSTDMLKLMTQMGKSMDSYTSASQHGQKRPGQRHSQF